MWMRRNFGFTPQHKMKRRSWCGSTNIQTLPSNLMLHTDTKITLERIVTSMQGLRVWAHTLESAWSQGSRETSVRDQFLVVQAVVENHTPREVASPVDPLVIHVLLEISVPMQLGELQWTL
jgi:hypothetical protein